MVTRAVESGAIADLAEHGRHHVWTPAGDKRPSI